MVNLWLFCFFPLLLCAAGSDSDACEEGTPHLSRNPAARLGWSLGVTKLFKVEEYPGVKLGHFSSVCTGQCGDAF